MTDNELKYWTIQLALYKTELTEACYIKQESLYKVIRNIENLLNKY